MRCLVATVVASWLRVAADPAILTAHFIDIGRDDSCWLRPPSDDDVLLDGGKPQAGPMVVVCLNSDGVTDIDLTVATHGDSGHIRGLGVSDLSPTMSPSGVSCDSSSPPICASHSH